MAHKILVLLLLLVPVLCMKGTSGMNFRIYNGCPFTVWPAWLSNSGKPQLGNGGAELASYSYIDVGAPGDWAGRIWGRRGCDFSSGKGCSTGDCNGEFSCGGNGGTPPATLAEFTLSGSGGNDFFDVSLVDGYDLPVRISPSRGGCRVAGCVSDVNVNCPNELQVRDGSGVVGCKSACLEFGSDEYCCRGSFNSPQTCKPTSYSSIFKAACPQAYSYAYDDASSTFTCAQGGDYTVTFCP